MSARTEHRHQSQIILCMTHLISSQVDAVFGDVEKTSQTFSHHPPPFHHPTLTQELALLSEGSAGSVAGKVLERAGPPAVAGPQVVLGGVAVGAVGLLKVLRVCVRVVLVLRWMGEGGAVADGR